MADLLGDGLLMVLDFVIPEAEYTEVLLLHPVVTFAVIALLVVMVITIQLNH
ncbi:MAG: hypothetical protein QJT81_10875 [Candidatus Thiothrix putei]|uniref:Uncharacterized protein n=1 Tax=Candidatus Thiothrix putei TaxID=3080811 RepID=A0AA95HI65_9GAMM|nr:MAG: hypothetical protein QJT81_10875 [Candidatus Thiothrix putei]